MKKEEQFEKAMKKEEQFEKDLSQIASLLRCRYYKIPDTKMLNKYNRSQNKENKRPFDGILCTPKGNFIIECKVDNNTLSFHQEVNLEDANKINGSGYVIRKKFLKKGVFYHVEKRGKLIFSTEKIEIIVKYFSV